MGSNHSSEERGFTIPGWSLPALNTQGGELASVVHRDLLIDLEFGQRKRPAWGFQTGLSRNWWSGLGLDPGASIRHARTARPEIPDDLNLAHILVEELAHDGKPNRTFAKGQDKFSTRVKKVGLVGREGIEPPSPRYEPGALPPGEGSLLERPRRLPVAFELPVDLVAWAGRGAEGLCAPPSMETALGRCPRRPWLSPGEFGRDDPRSAAAGGCASPRL